MARWPLLHGQRLGPSRCLRRADAAFIRVISECIRATSQHVGAERLAEPAECGQLDPSWLRDDLARIADCAASGSQFNLGKAHGDAWGGDSVSGRCRRQCGSRARSTRVVFGYEWQCCSPSADASSAIVFFSIESIMKKLSLPGISRPVQEGAPCSQSCEGRNINAHIVAARHTW